MTPLPSRNVLGGPLKPCSTDPVTGFFRNGHCDTCDVETVRLYFGALRWK